MAPFSTPSRPASHPSLWSTSAINHVGFDAGTTVGSFGLRLDAAYDSNHVVLRRDLTGLGTRAARATASVEYQTGDFDKVFLLEGSVQRLFDATSQDSLLFVNPTTVSGTALVRFPIYHQFNAELRAVGTVAPWSIALRPQLAFEPSDHFLLALGGLWLTGDAYGLGGYYSRNSDVHVIAKYTF